MSQINAYISFNGNCREAMTFYKECLGGELTIQTIGESPMANNMPEEKKGHIIHSMLKRDNLILMGSDMKPEQLINGNSITLSINCDSEEEVKRMFANLCKDGNVSHPLSESFWGSTFGHLTDKYGIQWMLNYEKSEK